MYIPYFKAMGGRKFKLGRHHKNYERKRQAKKKSKAGRPTKAYKISPSHEALPAKSTPHSSNLQVCK